MPILEIEIVGPVAPGLRAGLAARLADAAGAALGTRPGGCWVKLRFLDETDYAENAGGPPPGVRPMFVRLLQSEPESGERLRARVLELTRAVAGACGRPAENVHLLLEPAARGRLAFGGELLE